MHVHVVSTDGEAKYWIEPTVSLARYAGFSDPQLNELQKIVEERKDDIVRAWKKHFKD